MQSIYIHVGSFSNSLQAFVLISSQDIIVQGSPDEYC